jgi:hypothetical protein
LRGGSLTTSAVAVVTAEGGDSWRLQSDRHPVPLTYEQARRWCDQIDESSVIDAPLGDLLAMASALEEQSS